MARSKQSVELASEAIAPYRKVRTAWGAVGLKKIDERRRMWLIRRAGLSWARKRLSSQNQRVRRASGLRVEAFGGGRWVTMYSNGQTQRAKLLGEPRPVPAILCLDENYSETATFLMELRGSLFESYRRNGFQRTRVQRRAAGKAPPLIRRFWDFSLIQRISAEVALIIAAEFNRFHRGGSWIPRAIDIEKWRPDVREMLTDIGFLSLAGTDPPTSDVLSGTGWSILKLRAGHEAEGEQVKRLLGDLGVRDMIDNGPLYDAIMEGLVNTIHHAYPSTHTFEEPHFSNWWMTGFIDRESRWFTVMIYDQGLSIPATLPNWKHFSTFRRRWSRLFGSEPDADDMSKDGVAIRMAMKVGKTQTNEETRGKGLHAMEEAVNLCDDGDLAIFSRCGEYRKITGRTGRHVNRNIPIGGTLIVWSMRFNPTAAEQ
jgi:hypothetical protein